MTNPAIIPANFRVPKRCRHRWILVAGPCRMELKGVPGKRQTSLEYFQTGEQGLAWLKNAKLNPLSVESIGLDWLQESVEHLRYLCEK